MNYQEPVQPPLMPRLNKPRVNADGFIPSPATGVYFDSFKASVRWGSSSSWFRLWFSSSAVAGGDDFRHLRITVGLGTLLQFSFLSGSSVKFGLHSSLCILAVRFCMCMRTCMLSLSRNTEMYYQKKTAYKWKKLYRQAIHLINWQMYD